MVVSDNRQKFMPLPDDKLSGKEKKQRRRNISSHQPWQLQRNPVRLNGWDHLKEGKFGKKKDNKKLN